MSYVNKKSFKLFLSNLNFFHFFLLSFALARISSKMLDKSGEKYKNLSDFREKHLVIHH